MVRGRSQKESEPPASDLFDAVRAAKSDMQAHTQSFCDSPDFSADLGRGKPQEEHRAKLRK